MVVRERTTGQPAWQFPIWIQIIAFIVLAVAVIYFLVAVYRHFLKNIIGKKVKVKACLVSKVEEQYKEVKSSMRSTGIPSPQSGFIYGKKGTAYRLYFKTEKGDVQLDVTKEIFDRIDEGSIGILEYKGDYFYSFK